MELEPVESSAISRLNYHPADGTLVLEFPRGDLYFYSNVPAETYDDFQAADSMGQFYRQNIRGQFKRVKIPVEERDDDDIPDTVR